MKLNTIVLATALLAAAFSTQSQAAIIAQWTFEPAPADASGAIYPNAIAASTGTGNAGGVHTAVNTAWSTPVGNGSTDSFSSNNWAVGDYYQFQTSTLGFNSINLSWDQTSSNTGPRDFKLSYSLNGTNFSDFATYSVLANVAPNAWSSTTPVAAASFSQNLFSIAALSNQANVYFRLIDISTTSANGGTVASGGTNRVDNFTVYGTAVSSVPLPGAIWLFGSALMGMLGFKRRKA